MKDHRKELYQEQENLVKYLRRRVNSIREKVGSSDKKNFIFEAYNRGLSDGFSLAAEWLEEIIERRNNND